MPHRKKKLVKEYRLLIAPHFNERQQKFNTLVVLETADSFASFQYDIAVEERIEKKAIRYKVLGLKAPSLSLPAPGHARFTREYEDLHGTYEVLVEGLDGSVSTSSVRIKPEQVKLLKPPVGSFVHVFTDPAQWNEH